VKFFSLITEYLAYVKYKLLEFNKKFHSTNRIVFPHHWMYVKWDFAFLFYWVNCLHDLRKIFFLFFETIWSKEWNVLWEKIGFLLQFALLLVTERWSGCPRFIEPLSVPQEDCSNFRIIARCWQRSHCRMKTYGCQKNCVCCLDTNRNAFDVFFNKKVQQNGCHIQLWFYSVSSSLYQILKDSSMLIIENVIFNNHTYIFYLYFLTHKLTLIIYYTIEYLKCFTDTRNSKLKFLVWTLVKL